MFIAHVNSIVAYLYDRKAHSQNLRRVSAALKCESAKIYVEDFDRVIVYI